MGFKLTVNVNVYNEQFAEQSLSAIDVMMRGLDEPLVSGETDSNGWFFVSIDKSDDLADSPSEVYVYCSRPAMRTAATILYSGGQPFYAGQDSVKTYPFDGSVMLISG